MKRIFNIEVKRFIIALFIICVAHMALASFTGTMDDKTKAKYSLKNFNKIFYKKASAYSLTAGYQFKGIQLMSEQKNPAGTTLNLMMRYENGNTTYIYPYKHKVSVSKFKTPSRPIQ